MALSKTHRERALQIVKVLAAGALPGSLFAAGSAASAQAIVKPVKPVKIVPAVTTHHNCGDNVDPSTLKNGHTFLKKELVQDLNSSSIQVRSASSSAGVNHYLWARVTGAESVGIHIFNDWTKPGNQSTSYNFCSHTIGTGGVNYTNAHRAHLNMSNEDRGCASGTVSNVCTRWSSYTVH